ncbi:MAG: hypothetical protein Q8P45_01775 [Candidatus Harrisonbacteria bacterium]|nr:hypothetical protein [Candidatus Harrisonbacteria bacterium]
MPEVRKADIVSIPGEKEGEVRKGLVLELGSGSCLIRPLDDRSSPASWQTLPEGTEVLQRGCWNR